jgi:hypothetical protein
MGVGLGLGDAVWLGLAVGAGLAASAGVGVEVGADDPQPATARMAARPIEASSPKAGTRWEGSRNDPRLPDTPSEVWMGVNGTLRPRSQDSPIVGLVIDRSKERMLGNVMTVTCRSYSAQAFDGCPACVDAALEAVEQAGIYVLGQAAPDLASQPAGPIEMAYRMKVKLVDEAGYEMAADELETEQTIEAVPLEYGSVEDIDDPAGDLAEFGKGWYQHDTLSSMRLDDFQTSVDRLELAPAGRDGITGVMAGRLFGFERWIGGFEIAIAPGR